MGCTRKGIKKEGKFGTYHFQGSFTFPKLNNKGFRVYLQLPMLFSLSGLCRPCREGGSAPAPEGLAPALTCPPEQPILPADLKQELGVISLVRLTLTCTSPPSHEQTSEQRTRLEI